MAAPSPSPPSPATPTPTKSPGNFSISAPRIPYGMPHTSIKIEASTSNNVKEKSLSSIGPFPREPSSASVPTAIAVPSHSRWFSFEEIHATERRMLPEFFDVNSPSKNPSLYKYYRNFIIRRFRENPARKITFTEVRRALVGDVGSVRRVFDFLETWGLINYSGSEKQAGKSGVDEKEKRRTEEAAGSALGGAKSLCTSCKSECNIVCFATEKVPDLILCARCFVRGSFRGGLTHADFKRIDVSGGSEEKKRDWTDKDLLHLLEALLLHGDDWKKVAEHVGGGKSERDCVMRFIQLPFSEQFMDTLGSQPSAHHHQEDDHDDDVHDSSALKKMALSPLADASNPIMSQVAFMAAVSGSEIVEAASRAAIAALDEVNADGDVPSSDQQTSKDQNAVIAEARNLLETEERDVESSISQIVTNQMKGMLERIIHFEELELLLEREWLQLHHLRNLLFVDKLNLLQQRSKSLSQDGVEKVAFEASGKE